MPRACPSIGLRRGMLCLMLPCVVLVVISITHSVDVLHHLKSTIGVHLTSRSLAPCNESTDATLAAAAEGVSRTTRRKRQALAALTTHLRTTGNDADTADADSDAATDTLYRVVDHRHLGSPMVNVRAGPSLASDIVQQLKPGTVVMARRHSLKHNADDTFWVRVHVVGQAASSGSGSSDEGGTGGYVMLLTKDGVRTLVHVDNSATKETVKVANMVVAGAKVLHRGDSLERSPPEWDGRLAEMRKAMDAMKTEADDRAATAEARAVKAEAAMNAIHALLKGGRRADRMSGGGGQQGGGDEAFEEEEEEESNSTRKLPKLTVAGRARDRPEETIDPRSSAGDTKQLGHPSSEHVSLYQLIGESDDDDADLAAAPVCELAQPSQADLDAGFEAWSAPLPYANGTTPRAPPLCPVTPPEGEEEDASQRGERGRGLFTTADRHPEAIVSLTRDGVLSINETAGNEAGVEWTNSSNGTGTSCTFTEQISWGGSFSTAPGDMRTLARGHAAQLVNPAVAVFCKYSVGNDTTREFKTLLWWVPPAMITNDVQWPHRRGVVVITIDSVS